MKNETDEEEIKIVQYDIIDYPTFHRLIDKNKVKLALRYFNLGLKKYKVTMEDIRNYSRVKMWNVFKYVALHSASYLNAVRYLLESQVNPHKIPMMIRDIRDVMKKYRKVKRREGLTPTELIEYLRNPKANNPIINFGIHAQGIYGIRFVSLKWATFDVIEHDFYNLPKQNKKFDRFFAVSLLPNFYEEAKKVALQFFSERELQIIKSSRMIIADKVQFYWKGQRYEEFNLHPLIKQVAEHTKQVRIQSIYNILKPIFDRDSRLEEEKSIRTIKLYRRWILPFYFSYSEMQYRNYLRKIFGKYVSYHDIRRAFATLLHTQGFDIVEIKEALRHRDVKTTQLYINEQREKLTKKLNSTLSKILEGKSEEEKVGR